MSEMLNHNIIIKYDDIEKIDCIPHDHRKNLLLISPMLHQGGFERICVATARIMKDDYNVTIVIFSNEDVAYDVSGLNVVNLDLGVRNGQLAKTLNILKRRNRLKALEKRLKTDIVYSFGLSAGIVNCAAADRVSCGCWSFIRTARRCRCAPIPRSPAAAIPSAPRSRSSCSNCETHRQSRPPGCL